MKITHWIFDLDGTVIDTVRDLARAISDTLISFNLPPVTIEETEKFIGGGARQFVELALKGKGDDLVFFERFFAAYMIRYDAYQLEAPHPYPGITALLKHLKAAGCHAYIFSNKPHDLTVKLITSVFPDLFTGVHGHIPGTEPKPDRVMYDRFAALHQINPQQSVFIGDSPPDILMGQKLGMPTIAVTYGYTEISVLKAYKPSILVDTVAEILPAVKTLEKTLR
jgi:phosphoglycolate phosphatase